MIANLVLGVCGCTPLWTMERYVEERVEQVRQQVGDQSVFLLASGGVDPTVAARLLGMAIGPERLHLLHVDNGLMRKDESREFVIVRPIHSERAMTATPAQLPDALTAELRRQILALPGVSGLALDVTTKPPGTIEWE